MCPVLPEYIMFMARIDHIIHLDVFIYGRPYKTNRVLLHHHIVLQAMDQEQLALELAYLAGEVGSGIPFGVFPGRIHISFAIHDLVIAPVRNRAARNGHLEDTGVVEHEIDRHKTAVAPAEQTHAFLVYERLAT